MSLSAISNGKNYYSIEISDEFGRANEFTCIGCNGEMVFHRNISGIKIQHFVHKVTCPFETEPETAEHIKMKSWCYENIPATKKYKPDSIMVGNQKPDVLFEVNGKQVAIECQCSKIGYEKWEYRTRSYSEKGIYVLWLLGTKFLEGEGKLIGEKRINQIEKKLHKLNYGRVYYLRTNFEEETFNGINPIHYQSAIREAESNYWSDGGIYYLKTTKRLSPYPDIRIKNYSLLLIEHDGYKIARFYDKKWWES